MSDAPALLAAIRAAPADDAPRLVYADWLDEHGQAERAEFIRVQCELARRANPALRRREAELLAAHHDALAGPLAAPHLRFRFDRGFIVGFGHVGAFAADPGLHDPYVNRPYRHYLRFFPDRTVIGAQTTETPFRVVRWLVLGAEGIERGEYQIGAFDLPLTIQFTFPAGPNHFRGELTGDLFVCQVQYRDQSYLPPRRYYSLHPVKGFDSFPET